MFLWQWYKVCSISWKFNFSTFYAMTWPPHEPVALPTGVFVNQNNLQWKHVKRCMSLIIFITDGQGRGAVIFSQFLRTSFQSIFVETGINNPFVENYFQLWIDTSFVLWTAFILSGWYNFDLMKSKKQLLSERCMSLQTGLGLLNTSRRNRFIFIKHVLVCKYHQTCPLRFPNRLGFQPCAKSLTVN